MLSIYIFWMSAMLKANIQSIAKFCQFYLPNILKSMPFLIYHLIEILIFCSLGHYKSISEASFPRPKDLNSANQIMTTSSLKSFSGPYASSLTGKFQAL